MPIIAYNIIVHIRKKEESKRIKEEKKRRKHKAALRKNFKEKRISKKIFQAEMFQKNIKNLSVWNKMEVSFQHIDDADGMNTHRYYVTTIKKKKKNYSLVPLLLL